jgi:HSP20 family protein
MVVRGHAPHCFKQPGKEAIMNIVRRSPSAMGAFRPSAMQDQFGRLVENMFEDMFAPFTHGGALSQWQGEGAISPRLNVSETDKAFEVQAELPGVKKEDVKVAIENQRVTIEGETKRENEQRQGENILYSERSASKFVRSFMLPVEVDDGSAEARMENGVLTLTLPKKQGSEAKRITIQ